MKSPWRIFVRLTLAAGIFASGMAVVPAYHRWEVKVHAAEPPMIVNYGCHLNLADPSEDKVNFVDASPKPFPYELPSVGSDCAAAGTLLMSEGLSRPQLAQLVQTNFFGQNAAAIASTEAQYQEMWAQDAAAQ